MVREETIEAIQDLRYLLNQGYPLSSAVEFVSDHYCLELERRHLLARCVFSSSEAREHKDKLVRGESVRGRRLGIDGYNVLITIESILSGDRVIKCDDGFIRDLQAIFGKYSMSDSTENALNEIIRVVSDFEPEEVIFFFDKQVSKSGELAGMTRSKIKKNNLAGDAKTTVGTDAKVRDFEVAASSDRGVIKKAERVWDIPAELIRDIEASVLDLTRI